MSELKFANNITSRVSTVNLERQLLHALMSDKINLQRTIGKHRSDFFTNNSRLFIYDCINSFFNDKRSVLTKNQFDFEIQKRFDSVKDKARIDDFNTEYELIKKITQTEDIDSIIANLEEIQLGNATDALIREAYAKLETGNYQDAANLLRQKSIDLKETQKEGRIINLHKDSDDWFEEVKRRKDNPQLYAGIPTGFKKFDNLTGGLFPAELTIVFGLSGKGKSTFMKALSCNIRKQGRVVLHCGNEENEFQIRSKYMSADSGIKYSPFKKGNYDEKDYKKLKTFSDEARKVGDIYIYEFPQQTDATWIERAYRNLEMQGIHVDVIVIDYLDLMKPVGKAYSENDEQGKITSDLKQIAINCHCPVITATQAGTQSEKQEKKAKPFLTSADVFGTKRKVHSANCLIGIVNQTATALANELDEKDRTKHHMVLCVPKNRDGAVFTFRQIMDTECGKFYEDEEDNPMMDNLEKQAGEMIDETVSPDKIRDEIDVKEIQLAKNEELNKKVANLAKIIEEESSSNENTNDFLNVSSNIEEDTNNISDINEEDTNNDFLQESSIENKSLEKENNDFNSDLNCDDIHNDFLNESTIDKVESDINVSEQQILNEEINNSDSNKNIIKEDNNILNNNKELEEEKEPIFISSKEIKNNNPVIDENMNKENKEENKLSDKISHKKSFLELLADSKRKNKT